MTRQRSRHCHGGREIAALDPASSFMTERAREARRRDRNRTSGWRGRERRGEENALPATLKAGIERLSGLDMSDVEVRYNSSAPARLNAHAYARGTQIHLARGREKDLPHEAWHVVQQKQQRVPASERVAGLRVNREPRLEREATSMGTRALHLGASPQREPPRLPRRPISLASQPVAQLNAIGDLSTAVNDAFNDRSQHPQMRGVGNTRWPQNDDFIIAGVSGTFHHIINKEKLRLLVKSFVWLQANLFDEIEDVDDDDDELGNIKDHAESAAESITAFFDVVGNPNGATIRTFYWRAENGFVGVRTDYRNDNPNGTDNESDRPTTLSQDTWDQAFTWYNALVDLEAHTSKVDTSTDDVDAFLTSLKEKLDDAKSATEVVTEDGDPHRTDDGAEADNQDWKKSAGAQEAWGSANKIYELK